MLYLVHVLAGAVIAKFVPSLFPLIILSLISHFIIDMIPHKDNLSDIKLTRKNYKKIKLTLKGLLLELADTLASLVLIAYLFLTFQSFPMLVGIFFSLFPDIIKIIYFTPLKNNKLFIEYMHFHSAIQLKVGWFIGILTQLIVALILSRFLFF